MAKALLQEWSNWTGWTEEQIDGTQGFDNNSNPVNYDDADDLGAGFHNVALYKAITWINAGEAVDVYCRVKGLQESTGASQFNRIGMYVKDTSGNSYPMFIEHAGTTGLKRVSRARRQAGRGILATDNAVLFTNGQWIDEEWTWLWMHIENGIITYYWLGNNSTIQPSNEDFGTAAGTYTPAAPAFDDPVVEVGVGAWETAFNAHMQTDDLRLITGAGIPIDNAVVDGVNVKIESTYASNAIGQIGASGKLIYHDPLHTLGLTVEAAHRTVATISETRFNQRFLQGEISGTNPVTREIILKDLMEKLKNTDCNYNPVLREGVIGGLIGNKLYKEEFGPNVTSVFPGSYADKFIVFQRTNDKRHVSMPATIAITNAGGTGITPDSEVGKIENLYYRINQSDGDDEKGWHVSDNDTDFYSELNFNSFLKNGSVITKAEIEVKLRVSAPYSTNPPTPWLFNYDSSTWEEITGLDKEDKIVSRYTDSDGTDDLGQTQSERRTFKFNITKQGTLLDYFSVGANNNLNFKQHTLSFRIYSGSTSGGNYKAVNIESALLTFDLDIDQPFELAAAKIETVTDHTLAFYVSGGVSWMSEDIYKDGLSVGGVDSSGEVIGDKYFICDKISDIATAFWITSGIDLWATLNFTLTDEIPDITNYINVKILETMTKWSELFNAAFFMSYQTDPQNDLPIFNFANSFVSSGLTLTDADIFDWEDNASIRINSDNEASTLKVIGKGVSGSTSITPEHASDLGLEVKLVTRPDINNRSQITQFLSKKKLIYKNAERFVTFKINYDFALQDYSRLDIGKTVEVKFPSTGAVANYVAGQQGALLIYQMELNRNAANGYNNFVTFICQKRTLS